MTLWFARPNFSHIDMITLPAIVVFFCAGLGAAVLLTLVLRARGVLSQLEESLAAIREGRLVRPVEGRFFGRLGRVVGLYNATIPERVQRLAQLEEDRLMLANVLEGMTEGVMAIDRRRHVLFANATARALFKFSDQDDGRLFAQLVRHPQLQRVVEAAITSESPHHEEVTLDRMPGSSAAPLILAVHARPVPSFASGGAVLVFHDITELRHLERMRQDFVANVSHELKTPIAAIRACAETLLDGAVHDPEVNVRFLQRIDDQANRLSQLILDMLSLSRLERGEDAFRHAPLVVAPIVRQVFDAHQSAASAKQQQFELRPGNVDEGVLVRADAEAIRQILNNLLENAIKYTPARGRITLSCRLRDEMIEFEVSDTGIGIPRDELPRVFERFYRVDEARSRLVEGTGLGLAIVKHLVQSLGGRVGVRSRLNAGSTFTVSLPRLRTTGDRPLPGQTAAMT